MAKKNKSFVDISNPDAPERRSSDRPLSWNTAPLNWNTAPLNFNDRPLNSKSASLNSSDRLPHSSLALQNLNDRPPSSTVRPSNPINQGRSQTDRPQSSTDRPSNPIAQVQSQIDRGLKNTSAAQLVILSAAQRKEGSRLPGTKLRYSAAYPARGKHQQDGWTSCLSGRARTPTPQWIEFMILRESIAAIRFAEDDEGFVNVSDFDASKGSEDRSNQGNFIGREGNHRKRTSREYNPDVIELLGILICFQYKIFRQFVQYRITENKEESLNPATIVELLRLGMY